MNKKLIGMIFSNGGECLKAFNRHADGIRKYPENYDGAVIDKRKQTISFEDRRWRYITISTNKDLNDIAGDEFDAVFSEVVNPEHKQFILSRFRPRFGQ